MNALEINGVNKSYKDFSLKNVSFNLENGTIMGLIGANGAGKSTLIKCILGMVKYEGQITRFGNAIDDEMKEEIGFVVDDIFLNDKISIKQANNIYKDIYKNWSSEKFIELANKFEIPIIKPYNQLSKGMKMKFEIAIALSSNPKLLIFDEPTSGLDPVIRSEILDLLLDFIQDEEHSVLISTHITSDLEKIADSITFIDNGEVIFSKEKYELLDEFAILKSDEDLDDYSDYIVKFRKGIYSNEALIKNAIEFKQKFPNAVVDKVSIDEIMVFYKRGNSYESTLEV